MTTEKMTVYKALCELKTLNARLVKEIGDAKLCALYKCASGKVAGVPVQEFEGRAKADFDKIKALSNRRNAIKRAVILSNASTLIRVNGEDITVAEAIDMKNNAFTFMEALYNAAKAEYNKAVKAYEKETGPDFVKRTDEYLKALFGKEGTQVNSDAVTKSREAYILANAHAVSDPLKIMKKIEDFENLKASVLDEIDSAISVSNATTYIQIQY